MAFPHLQQPSFLLVSTGCLWECQRDDSSAAQGLVSAFLWLEPSAGGFLRGCEESWPGG